MVCLVLFLGSNISEVVEEYRHPDLITPSGDAFELDLYYPEFKLAVEFQVKNSI
jgi:hypothetical protein